MDMTAEHPVNNILAIHRFHVTYIIFCTDTGWRGSSKCRKQAACLKDWVPLKYLKYILIWSEEWGSTSSTDLKFSLLFYLLHNCISEVSDFSLNWTEIHNCPSRHVHHFWADQSKLRNPSINRYLLSTVSVL